jgi:hypothetical protein
MEQDPSYLRPRPSRFILPIDRRAVKFEFQAEEAIRNSLFEGIEESLDYGVNENLLEADAFERQLDYAVVLSEIGEVERANDQFRFALVAIKDGQSFRRRSFPVAESEFKKNQALAYGRMAAKLYEAGFWELTDAVSQEAEQALSVSIASPDELASGGFESKDWARAAREARVALKVAKHLITAGRLRTAESIRQEVPLTRDNYELHIDVLEALKQWAVRNEQFADAEAYLSEQEDVIRDTKEELLALIDETGMDSSLVDVEVRDLVDAANKYGLPIDTTDILESASAIIIENSKSTIHKAYNLSRIIRFCHQSATTQKATLSKLLIDIRQAQIEDPAFVDEELVEDIARTYALMGEHEHVEVLVDNTPLRHRLGIRQEQLKAALEQEDFGMARSLLRITLEETKARFREDGKSEIDDWDFRNALDLAIALGQLDDYASMDEIYKMLKSRDSEMLGYENEDKNLSIANLYLLSGNIAGAFEAIRHASDTDQAGFLINILASMSAFQGPQPFDLLKSQVLLSQIQGFNRYRQDLRHG